MEDGDLRGVVCGGAEMKGQNSSECWVLFVEEEIANEVVEVHLTDVFSECLE